jgi:hypothetical protein
MRTVQLVAAGSQQSYEGWRRLEKALSTELRQATGSRNPFGFSLVCFGVLLVVVVAISMVTDAETVAQSLREMLRL